MTVGLLLKSDLPTPPVFDALKKIGQQKKAVFIQIEPDVRKPLIDSAAPDFSKENNLFFQAGCTPGRPAFSLHNFFLDLTPNKEILFNNIWPQTRNNIKLAQKNGVTVSIDNYESAIGEYLNLAAATAKKQKLYTFKPKYYVEMWRLFQSAGMAYILKAVHQGNTLAAWMLFKYKNTLYYPFGASLAKHELKASHLAMWEAICFGQKNRCHSFDLWGCLGPNPDIKDPWYGIHRFKESFNPQLYQNIGSFDLVINFAAYKLYGVTDKIRWKFLKLKAMFG